MIGWKKIPLGDAITLQRGYDLPCQLRRHGVVPVISSAGTSDWHDNAMVTPPGVVTGRYGTIGKLFFIQEPFWPLNTTLYVKNFHGNEPKYIYYLLQLFDFNIFSGKSGVPGVNRNDIHAELVCIPNSIEEQQAIVAVLSDADALIDALEQGIAKKRHIKQGAMQELLTGKRRLPGFEGEWILCGLGSVLTVAHGKNQKMVEDPDGEYPILASGGKIGTANQFIYDSPSILIGRKGTIDKPQYMDTPFWTVDTLFYTQVKQGNVPKFLYYLFFLIDWYSYNEASGVPSLNVKTIESISVNLPPLDKNRVSKEQTAIAAVLTAMDDEIAALEAKLSKARQIKAGMMQELLTGRIRLV